MKAPSDRTIKRLFALSRNQCAYPACQTAIVQPTGTPTGEICHIKARNTAGPRFDPTQSDEERHEFENLILLCSVHHKIVDDQPERFSVELLREMKSIHERNGNCELTQEDVRLAQRLLDAYVKVETAGDAQVMLSSPGGVQVNNQIENLTIKTTKRTVKVQPPAEAIASCLPMRNYALYLIRRYNDFQKADAEKLGSGKYRIIYRAMQRQFGAKWDMVPRRRFDDLVSFLQTRILKTKLGRIQHSRGRRCFKTYQEFLDNCHDPYDVADHQP